MGRREQRRSIYMYHSADGTKSRPRSDAEHKHCSGPTTFRSWREVPKDEWRTAKEWKQVSRMVQDGEKPTGRVVYTEVVSGLKMFDLDPDKVLYQDDEHAEIIVKAIPLYHISQTRPAKISRRTLAFLKYAGIFHRHARKDQYIVRQIDPETSAEAWTTITANESGGTPWQRQELAEDDIRKHVIHTEWTTWIDRKPFRRHTIGIKATDVTRFVAIDLDNHAKDDTELFLKRAEALLDHFHGGGWHYQVRDGAVTGIHFIKVFDKSVPLEDAHQQVHAALEKIDKDHPDLHVRDVEVYPDKRKGFRLPLARNYLMILNGIVEPVTYRQQKAGAVEAYMAWLENPNRAYFPKDRLIGFLRMNADDTAKPKDAALEPKRAVPGTPVPSQLGKLRGRCWPKITGYWQGDFNPPKSFDAVVTVTARIARFFGHPQDRTVAAINQFAKEIPEHARHCSSRVATGDWDEIDRCITKQTISVYAGNVGQNDVAESDRKLQAAVAAWSKRGWDILDKATWGKQSPPAAAIALTDEDRRIIEAGLADLLGPQKYRYLAGDVAIAMAQLVQHKMVMPINNVRERATAYNYWAKFLHDRFGIRTGNKNKVANILKAAKDLGIIKTWCRHSKAHKRATIYEPGERMRKYLVDAGEFRRLTRYWVYTI